jgi:RHS repeat-associated protein
VTVSYSFDGLGRTLTKGGLRFTYGPNGHLSTAQSGTTSWQFLYDESGQRILKSTQGVPVAGYVEGGLYLDATGLTEPVRLGGQVVGVVRSGVFQMVATDGRGTVMADTDGTLKLASPFGERQTHPQLAAALDYVEKGYDADLGLVRMGVRDYDAQINRFLTPDPLFLEHPDRCLASPVECNLYAYVKGNPVNFVDPQGTCSAPAGLKVGEVGLCIETFISTKYVPRSASLPSPGLGDNRRHNANDATLTARTISWLKVSITDIKENGQTGVKVHTEAVHSAGVSEATPWGPGIQGGNEAKVSTPGYDFAKNALTLQYSTFGVNGWNIAWPLAPMDPIQLQVGFSIGRDGKVGLLPGGKHDGFPSYGIYSYVKQADGSIKTTTLYEFKEITIDRLGGELDVAIMKQAPK